MASPDIPLSQTDLLQYFAQHWRDEVTIVTGAPIAFAVAVLLVSLILRGVFHLLHKRELDTIPILKERLDAREEDIARRDREITTKDKEIARLKEQSPTLSPISSSEVFYIEYRQQDLKWRENREKEQYPIIPQLPAPSSATLILQIEAWVSAIPSTLVQNIQLEIMGTPLLGDDWRSTTLKSGTLRLFFAIPSSIPLGKHYARIVATISQNGSEVTERKFPPFEVRIARSYKELHK